MPRAHRATPAEIEMRARTRAASRRSVESTTRRECSRNWELRWQKVGHMHLLKWAPMGKVSTIPEEANGSGENGHTEAVSPVRDSGDEGAEQRTVPSKEYREYSALCTLMYSADVSALRRSQFVSDEGEGDASTRRDSMDTSEHSAGSPAARGENAQAQKQGEAVANGGGNGVDVAEAGNEHSGGSSSTPSSAPSSSPTSAPCPAPSSAPADAMDVE